MERDPGPSEADRGEQGLLIRPAAERPSLASPQPSQPVRPTAASLTRRIPLSLRSVGLFGAVVAALAMVVAHGDLAAAMGRVQASVAKRWSPARSGPPSAPTFPIGPALASTAIAPGGIPGAAASGLGPVAVVGDSNSVAPWFTPGWVEMTERLLGFDPGGIVNTSIPGAMAGPHPDEPLSKSGPKILGDALAAGVNLDAVLLVLGTNDILVGRSANEIMAHLQTLVSQVASYDLDLPVFIAQVAPITAPVDNAEGFQAEVDMLNAMIADEFPYDRVIDFATSLGDGPLGTEFTYYNDGVHHNALASGIKADAVADALIVYFDLIGTGF